MDTLLKILLGTLIALLVGVVVIALIAVAQEAPIEVRSGGTLVTCIPSEFKMADKDFTVTPSNATVTIRYELEDGR